MGHPNARFAIQEPKYGRRSEMKDSPDAAQFAAKPLIDWARNG
jgi:hypothetical protein